PAGVALGTEEAVAELGVGGDEEVEEEAGGGQQPEAAAVAAHGDLGMGPLEAPGLGQTAGQTGHEGDAPQADHVVEAPSPGGDVSQLQGDDPDPGAQGGGHGDEAYCVRA